MLHAIGKRRNDHGFVNMLKVLNFDIILIIFLSSLTILDSIIMIIASGVLLDKIDNLDCSKNILDHNCRTGLMGEQTPLQTFKNYFIS